MLRGEVQPTFERGGRFGYMKYAIVACAARTERGKQWKNVIECVECFVCATGVVLYIYNVAVSLFSLFGANSTLISLRFRTLDSAVHR